MKKVCKRERVRERERGDKKVNEEMCVKRERERQTDRGDKKVNEESV